MVFKVAVPFGAKLDANDGIVNMPQTLCDLREATSPPPQSLS
jgi:hypothetical protein